MRSSVALTIGVDVGGTKVAAGVVDEDGRILAQLKRGTPSTSVDRTADAIAEVVDTLRAAHSVASVGIGAAGFIEPGGGTVRFAPNLAWRDEPLKAKVEVRVGLPTVVENDANAMAWGSTVSVPAAARKTCWRSRSVPASAAASCSTGGCTAASGGSPPRSATFR